MATILEWGRCLNFSMSIFPPFSKPPSDSIATDGPKLANATDAVTTTVTATTASPRLWALIACAGVGARAGAAGPKQYQSIAGRPLVEHTLAAFTAVPRLAGILVVVASDDLFFDTREKTFSVAHCGGATRAQTVCNGLQALRMQGAAAQDWVLVHDAARCLIQPAQIDALIDACAHDHTGGLLALRLPDTLKQAAQGRSVASIERTDKWLAQTPQMFKLADLERALSQACAAVTDESSAIEAMGLQPLLVDGSIDNFKVTYPHDFALAQTILQSRQANPAS
jgi:2-C-methyl-D-erythritol 4-phosphate cytidylyltransferase